MRASKHTIGDFWDEQFDAGERDFTEWLLSDEDRPPIGSPTKLRFEIEKATDTYLWNLEPEANYYDGEFYIDGLGRGFHNGAYTNVVIEAQLGTDKATSFKHLGKLFVYATLADADVVIWITPRKLVQDKSFPRAVSYIDDHSEIDFYQLFIDVTQIGDDSLDITVDNMYEAPNTTGRVETEFAKSQKAKFWIMLEDMLTDKGQFSTNATAPGSRTVYWCGGAVSLPNVNPEFRIDSLSNHVKFRVRFEGEQAEAHYRSLKHRPTSFEDRIPRYQSIRWLDGVERQTPVFEITRSGFFIDDQRPWKGLIQWLFRSLSVFRDEL